MSFPKLFAFYGTLRKDQGNYNWALKNKATYLKTIQVKGYDMFSLGGYPICIPSSRPDSEITVDIFTDVEPRSIDSIDRMESGAGYDHEILKVDNEDCLMYVGAPKHYTFEKLQLYYTQIIGGDWVEFKNSPKKLSEAVC